MAEATSIDNNQDLVLSGNFGKSSNSARSGYLPIALDRLPLEALAQIPVYLRAEVWCSVARSSLAGQPFVTTSMREGTVRGHDTENGEAFVLYAGATVGFTEHDRKRLAGNGVKFLYIPIAEQKKFRSQVEAQLESIAGDPATAIAEKAAIIYETSVELMNELLTEPDLAVTSPRLETVSRAVTTLVINDATSFSHLFTASHHDFYTATHMLNVATWMVPLAYAMGYRDPEVLNQICQAGLLHDMGKLFIPEAILNKTEQLSDEDWNMIKQHPVLGCDHLEKFGNVNETILTITRQHHERLDGSGYPDGLKADEIHPLARLCAVVDSFDAMTAFRPFKQKTFDVSEALAILVRETPEKYDPDVLEVWMSLMTVAEPGCMPGASDSAEGACRREHERHCVHAPGRLHQVNLKGNDVVEELGVQATIHSLSRSGMGFLSPAEVLPGQFVRLYMQTPDGNEKGLEGQAVRCCSHPDGWYEVGVRFAKLAAGSGEPDRAAA